MEKLCAYYRIIHSCLLLALHPIISTYAAIPTSINVSSADSLRGKLATSGLAKEKVWEQIWKFGVVKETTKPVSEDLDILGWLPKISTVDLSVLKNPVNSNPFRLMAIGGSYPEEYVMEECFGNPS